MSYPATPIPGRPVSRAPALDIIRNSEERDLVERMQRSDASRRLLPQAYAGCTEPAPVAGMATLSAVEVAA